MVSFNYKFSDRFTTNNLQAPIGPILDTVKGQQISRFAAFIYSHKKEACTTKENRSGPLAFDSITTIDHNINLNVFTDQELKEFIKDLKIQWLQNLTEYGQSTL